ncbi:myosin heavy chain, striated muscle-like isoform X2 [Cloeon dipterum]|uniref:myosin heavy chain, striated muscle-like isoform X2 n=1 Tax=Cloeon dipterum TaxID=197152 RepID=UPI003220446B
MEAESNNNDLDADEPALKPKVITRSAPNRQKFEKEFAEIKAQIDTAESQLQMAMGSNSPQARLQAVKEKREVAQRRRKDIIGQLDDLKKQIDTKRDAASQLRSKLQYQSEEQIEQLARKLETQLQQHSFRLSEERRLVAEIDKLRRSKKAVRQYNEAKDELNRLRESQQGLRLERDAISGQVGDFRTQEDELHTTVRSNRELVENLKKELDVLHEKKRKKWAAFKGDQAAYSEYREQKRTEVNKQRQQEKQAFAQARAEERREQQNNVEPYEVERQLCATLLSYLVSPEEPKTLPNVRDDAEDSLSQGMEALFAGIPRKPSRKVRRSGSRAGQMKKRPVVLTPDLLEQFAKVGVKPPVTSVEIPVAIEAIKAQQKWYNRMAAAELAARCQPPDSNEENQPAGEEQRLPSRALTLTLTKRSVSPSQISQTNFASDLANCVVTVEHAST